MRELRISKRADPAYVAAFRTLIQRLLRSAGSKEPIAMVLAGGAAMHLYTGARMTDDVDAVFNRKLLVPADLAVIYREAEGKARSVVFGANYNETYALLHEDAHQDAVRLPLKGIRGARIFVLQPVDLAVSKLARFADIDREDILELARNRLITARGLRERAEAALPYYVGNPIRLVVPFPAGESVDATARLVGQSWSAALGQQVLVDNRGGAGGTIGSDAVAKSAPDGYTLLWGNVGPLAIGPGLYRKLGYDVAKDFEPVSLVAILPFVLFTSPALPANSMVELLAYARAHPGELNFGSTGVGSGLHLIAELFKSEAGIRIVHVPYKGVAQAL